MVEQHIHNIICICYCYILYSLLMCFMFVWYNIKRNEPQAAFSIWCIQGGLEPSRKETPRIHTFF